MNNWIEPFYYFIIGATMLLTVMGLWFTVIIPGIDRWSRRFFLVYFLILMLCSFISLADMILYRYPGMDTVKEIFAFLETPLLTLPIPMLTAYLLHCCGKSIKGSWLFRIVLGLWSVFFLFWGSTLFTKYFFFSSPDGQFHRGPWFPLLILPLSAITLLNLACAIRWRKRLSRKYYFGFLIALLPITAALFLHAFVDVIPLIDISTVVSAVSMLGFILSDQIEQNLRQQRELAHQRASVMVLQMRPHYIYNTLMSIYSLCNLDPQKARQVTMDFTDYLRKNFNAVASEAPIPFLTELEHTRAYLAVEQAQFEDMLLVEFDTPFTQFRLPPLTLQPIVENAVKHGRDPYAGPLHVFVWTRKTDSGCEIVVSDDGRGFDPADESEPQLALNNIRQRLELMCGGSLTITPNDGGGTVVTLTIPDRTN